jgi:hypothetical protein
VFSDYDLSYLKSETPLWLRFRMWLAPLQVSFHRIDDKSYYALSYKTFGAYVFIVSERKIYKE